MRSLSRQDGYIGFNFIPTNPSSASGLIIPANLIIGFNSASAIPSGWTAFTSADGKFIRGTTSDGSIGSTGGSASASTYTSGSAGSHSTSNQDIGVQDWRQGSGSTTFQIRDTTSYGNHNHTVYNSYTPKRNNIRLMQADADESAIPANGIVWGASATAPDNLSAYATHNDNASGVMYAHTATGTTAATGSSSSNTKSYSHDHWLGGQGSRVNTSIATSASSHTMSHSHSWTASYTPNLNRTILKAWTSASEVIATSTGIIGLYDQSGVPSGWTACDGTGGTPNLNNYFIYNNGTAGGVTDGGNTLGCSANTNSWGHAHSYSGSPSYSGTTMAHKATINHYHSASSTPSWTPPYYYLKFIQYTG